MIKPALPASVPAEKPACWKAEAAASAAEQQRSPVLFLLARRGCPLRLFQPQQQAHGQQRHSRDQKARGIEGKGINRVGTDILHDESHAPNQGGSGGQQDLTG